MVCLNNIYRHIISNGSSQRLMGHTFAILFFNLWISFFFHTISISGAKIGNNSDTSKLFCRILVETLQELLNKEVVAICDYLWVLCHSCHVSHLLFEEMGDELVEAAAPGEELMAGALGHG